MIVPVAIWLVLALAWRAAMPPDARGRTWNIVHLLLPGLPVLAAFFVPPALAPPLRLFLQLGGAMLVVAAIGWAIGQAKTNHSLMDVLYPSVGMVGCAFTLAAAPEPMGARLWLLLALVGLWWARLTHQIAGTNMHVEREPYASLRKRFGKKWPLWAFFSIYCLQICLVWIWCLPFVFAATAPGGGAILAVDWAGAVIWLVGFIFQAVGDRQLARFKADPANRGRLMDRGLWAWTRHPNYFGESLMWCGYALFGLAHPYGVIGLVGAIYATWFMGWGSAVPGNERHMRKTRGALYEDYARRVPMFFPRPPFGR